MSSYSFQGRKRLWTQRDEEENRAIFSGQRQQTGIEMPQEFTPIYLVSADSRPPAPDEVERWTTTQLIRLLRLYGAHRCLWDVGDPDNRCRKMRKAALLDIVAAMSSDGIVATRALILQKINVLRATYRYERRRIKDRIRKGIGARTKLKWFAMADSFLRHVPKTEKFRKLAKDDSDSDLEDAVVFNIDPELLIPLNDADQKVEESHELRDVKEEAIEDVNFAQYSGRPLTKRPWTAGESIQFVQLLQEQPVLWSPANVVQECGAELDAVTSIAGAMQLPVERIRSRVATFTRTWRMESAKIARDPAYRPPFVWWPLAENFMTSSGAAYDNFVDANDVPPPTPAHMHDLIKMEHSEECGRRAEDDECEDEVQNPIPSVAPASVAGSSVEQAMSDLFNEHGDADRAGDCSAGVLPAKVEGNDGAPKLIWNGLEDDLLEGKWSLKHSVKFLRLYGAHRCLWDLEDAAFRSRELRHAAIKDIAAAMGYGLDEEYVAKKIKIFRITYMQHRKRMLETLKQGQKPEIQLRWFPLADSFLRPHIGLRSLKDDADIEMPQFDYQYVVSTLNLIDPTLLTDFRGKGTQNTIEIGDPAARDEKAPDDYDDDEELLLSAL